MANREKFLKLYSNLAINIRKEVILVLDENGPITWEVAYLEVENKIRRQDFKKIIGFENNIMKIDEEIKKIVIARLETLPVDKKISIGSSGEFSRDEIIDKIKKGDPIGKKMIQVELEFLRALKKGIIS